MLNIEANRLVRKAKYEYESIAINMQNDSKMFWKFIQSKTKTKENIPSIIEEQGEINTDDRIKAESMNKFVQSVFTVEVDSLSAPTLDQRTDEKLSTIKFSPKTAQKHLEKLKLLNCQGQTNCTQNIYIGLLRIYP